MSRKEMFLRSEKGNLRPLPQKRYVMKERKLMTVGKNSYVLLFKHHYSVSKEYVGRRVTILYDTDTVEIYCGMNLVATHGRCDISYTYSWKKEHNLPGHYDPYDKDLEELFGGNDRCSIRLREVRAFIAIYPLFERGDNPRFRIVEIVIQYADRLCESYYQCPIIYSVLFHRLFYLLFFLFNHISRFARHSSNVGATQENSSPSASW